MRYLLYLFTDCLYFTGHGRIDDPEYTKTAVGAGTKNTLQDDFRLRKPRTVSCVSSNVKRLHPKAEFRTGWTTSRSMVPWRTSTLSVKTVPRSVLPSWSKAWESLSSRVRNAPCISEFSPSVCPVRVVRECWWTISGHTYTEYRRCRVLHPPTRSRGALCQSRCSRTSRRHQVSLTSFGPQMTVLTERWTPRQLTSGGPSVPMK